MNHEAIIWVGCAVSAALGYVLGRITRPYTPPPSALTDDDGAETPAVHPYRDPAAPAAASASKKRFRLFPYLTHDDKYVALCCPACGAKVPEMPVCDCDEVDTDEQLHFHTKCLNCNLRFAMETRNAYYARRAREKREKAEAEKPKAN